MEFGTLPEAGTSLTANISLQPDGLRLLGGLANDWPLEQLHGDVLSSAASLVSTRSVRLKVAAVVAELTVLIPPLLTLI